MASQQARRIDLKILITGANGFIGKNLSVQIKEQQDLECLTFCRGDSQDQLVSAIKQADAVIHLAGENRPDDIAQFDKVNAGLTQQLCELLAEKQMAVPLFFASSIQAENNSSYGASKRKGEKAVAAYAEQSGAHVRIYRLPNVFGKWCRPNYNSVVATFCHNIANGHVVHIDNPETQLKLVYIDDVVSEFLRQLRAPVTGLQSAVVVPVYNISLGALAVRIKEFAQSRHTLLSERVGTGLIRALYATYISHLPPSSFAYDVPVYEDARGVFVEMLKTPDCGQFSFFTAHPGITRGGHYHHSKTEKFLVIKGKARFAFRHIITGEFAEIITEGGSPKIVETIPGWSHDITNIGSEEMVVMLWANEIFDRNKPDTITQAVH